MKKGSWTTTEDEMLREYVKKHGEGNWTSVQKNTGLARSGKSCRLRWANHLRPNLKKGSFSQDEQDKIIYLHSSFGNKWSRIAAALPGRTDNEVKNFWNSRTKRCFNTGTPIYPPSLQPINNVYPPPPPPSSLQNSTNFPHLSTAQLAANLQDLLSTLGSPYGPSLSLPPLSTLTNIPPPAPPSPDSAFAIHDCYQPDNGLLEDLLGEAPALPHDEDSTIPIIDLSDDQMDDSLSLPLSTGVKQASSEDEVSKEDDLLGLLDSFSSEMPVLDWNGGPGQSSTLAGPNNAQ